ncbi:hypothetical protein AOLI_G00063430 [Acnodon oligacanthus]
MLPCAVPSSRPCFSLAAYSLQSTLARSHRAISLISSSLAAGSPLPRGYISHSFTVIQQGLFEVEELREIEWWWPCWGSTREHTQTQSALEGNLRVQ